MQRKTMFIAHRGASGIEQENTIPAFIAASNRSYLGIECDVHITCDGKYVIYHDDETSRLCNKALPIEESSFDELRALCIKGHGTESFDSALIIPTLEEYLDILAQSGKTAVIELKRPMPTTNIREIIEICKTHYSLEKIIFISFHFDNLLTVRKLLPNQKLQFLTGECTEDTIRLLKEHSIDLDIIFTALNQSLVNSLHAHGIHINCWTCDDKHEAEKLIGWGVDFITSNILE